MEHSFENGLKFRSLPFLTHISLFNHCVVATNATSASCALELGLQDCPLHTLPACTKLGPIDDFAHFSSKFCTHFYLYNGFVTFSNTQHNLWHKLVLTFSKTYNICLALHHNPDVLEIFYGTGQWPSLCHGPVLNRKKKNCGVVLNKIPYGAI